MLGTVSRNLQQRLTNADQYPIEERGEGGKSYGCDYKHKSQRMGVQVPGGGDPRERVQYCNIPLPLPQPLRTEDTPVAQRLFIVCQPSAVPERILRDAFCRFGGLIDVYLLAGRNYGYAKYAKKENAMKAIQNLHGQNLAGQRVKVLEAEPPKSGEGDEAGAKKMRY